MVLEGMVVTVLVLVPVVEPVKLGQVELLLMVLLEDQEETEDPHQLVELM